MIYRFSHYREFNLLRPWFGGSARSCITICSSLIVAAFICGAHAQLARADEQYVTTSVGYYDHHRAHFKIPRDYKPDIHDSFFRIIVDYPSMRPTLGSRRPPINEDSLNIVVEGYPKNGTLGDDIVNGTLGSKFLGQKNGYQVYGNPLGPAGPATALVFRDPDGNNVAVEILGTWAVRNEITHGIAPHYVITFSISKKSTADFMDIDRSVSKLIAKMCIASDN